MRAWERFKHWVRHSGILHPTTFKVAAFAVACLVILAGLAARIGNISFFTSRVSYQAQLTDATGLTPSDAVKIAGVTVGQVTGVALQRGHALVTFAVDTGVHLPKGTEVGTQWANVLGQQFLYLYPGHDKSALKPGTTIPLSDNVPGPDLGALLNSLGPLLGALNPQEANQVVTAFADALQGDVGQVDQLIDNAASVSQSLGSVDTQVGQLVDNLNTVFGALAQRSGDLGQVVDNLDTVAQSLSSRNNLLDQTVSNLAEVGQEVSALEGNTNNSLSGAIADLDAVSADIQSQEGPLNEGLSTLGSGLAPYTDISAYGQWFQVQLVYTCLADETSCTYYEPTNAPAGSGLAGGLPSSSGLSPANGSSAASSLQSASVGDVLQMVAGEGNFLGSAQ